MDFLNKVTTKVSKRRQNLGEVEFAKDTKRKAKAADAKYNASIKRVEARARYRKQDAGKVLEKRAAKAFKKNPELLNFEEGKEVEEQQDDILDEIWGRAVADMEQEPLPQMIKPAASEVDFDGADS